MLPAADDAAPSATPPPDATVPDAAAVVRAACPPLDGATDDLHDRVAAVYDDLRDAVTASTDPDDQPSVEAADALAAAEFTASLRATLLEATLDGVGTAADYATDRLAEDLADRLPRSDASVTVSVDPSSTFAARYVRRQVEWAVTALASAVREYLGDALAAVPGTTPDERRVAAGAVDVLAGWHPPLVAGSTTLWALRHGVQAVAESVALVTGTRWRVLEGSCPHHDEVDGTVTGVEACFVVPGDDGPRCAYVVGEDRPFGCRCLQEPALGTVPHDPRALATDGAVTVTVAGERVTPLSDREHEVYREHAADGETFADLVRRVHDEASVAGGARALGVTKKTLYRWLDKYVADFDSYSGR